MKLWVSLSAIPLSVYRKWGGHGVFDRQMYEDLFFKQTKTKNAWRIYLPISNKIVQEKKVVVPAIVEKTIADKGYLIEDYVAGMAVDPTGKRKVKIGKLLDSNVDAKKAFDNDGQRKATKVGKASLFVVISRHPYDIAGMSTGRGWSSCTNLKDGSNRTYVKKDVKYGTLVAYLIKADDKNINKPVGRVRIYRYSDVKDPKRYLLVRDNSVYGAATPGFLTTIDEWLKTINGDRKEGTYCINEKVYDDDTSTSKIILVGTIDDFNKTAWAKKQFNPNTNPNEQVNFAPTFPFDEGIALGHLNLLEALTRSTSTPTEVLHKVFARVQGFRVSGNGKNSNTSLNNDTRNFFLNKVARNPNVDSDLLLKISEVATKQDSGDLVRAISNSPGLTEDIAQHILEDKPDAGHSMFGNRALSNDFWLRNFERIDKYTNRRVRGRYLEDIVENIQLPHDLSMRIMENPKRYDSDIRGYLAYRTTDIEVMRLSLKSKNAQVIEQTLRNPKLPSSLYREVLPTLSNALVQVILDEEKVPSDILTSIFQGKYSVETKSMALIHPNFVWTPDLIRLALQKPAYQDALLDSGVLDNISSEQKALLIKEGFLDVLLESVALNADDIDFLYDDLTREQKIKILHYGFSIGPTTIEKIMATDDVEIRATFARETNHSKVLPVLLKDPALSVRIAAVRNLNLSTSALEKLFLKLPKPKTTEDKDFYNAVKYMYDRRVGKKGKGDKK